MTSRGSLLDGVASYYSGKLAEHGPTAAGVDWNSERSQELRFAQLVKVVEDGTSLSINDYGCGYGALVDYIESKGLAAEYRGFDVSEDMVVAACQRFRDRPHRFTADENDLPIADYTIASGIFNVKLGVDDQTWLAHVLETLDRMRALSTKGLAFNMLTSYSDPERMRPDLFYPDPRLILDHCIRRFSRRVAILHDYELYEFTTLVRLD